MVGVGVDSWGCSFTPDALAVLLIGYECAHSAFFSSSIKLRYKRREGKHPAAIVEDPLKCILV